MRGTQRRASGQSSCRIARTHSWHKAESAILCFILYLVPGFPKDILCYLFGFSPMPFWLFAVASTLGRLPGTWVLSAEGATTASGHYVEMALVMGIVAALGVPLYAARHRILARYT